MSPYASLKECIITCLLKMETEQRLQGLITELAFDINISKKVLDEPIFGWFYHNGSRGPRDWYKVVIGDFVMSAAEKELINLLSPYKHDFFIIHPTISLGDPPQVTFTVRQYRHGPKGPWELRKNEDREKLTNVAARLEKTINSGLEKVQENVPKSEGKNWFEALDLVKLETLFTMRCMMNFFVANRPTDIDAICIDKELMKLSFVEFKRKSPAENYFTLIENSTLQGYESKASEFRNILRTEISTAKKKKSLDEVKKLRQAQKVQIMAELNNTSIWRKTKDLCYGLDILSHVPNVALCEQHNIPYLYLIWNRQMKLAEQAQVNLTELIGPDFHTVGSENVEYIKLQLAVFLGYQ